jgi:uncharacterized protein YqeY
MKEKDLKVMLKKATKAKDINKKYTLRMILGEIPRLNKKKGEEVTKDDINGIITKLIKSELIVLEYSGVDESKSEYLNILKSFIPAMMTEKEIESWIFNNVDFDSYATPIKAMGFIMSELKGSADGNLVRLVLMERCVSSKNNYLTT